MSLKSIVALARASPVKMVFSRTSRMRIGSALLMPESESARPYGFCNHVPVPDPKIRRSEEHTSELQSLMRISYAVFCLKKKKYHHIDTNNELTHVYDNNMNAPYSPNYDDF